LSKKIHRFISVNKPEKNKNPQMSGVGDGEEKEIHGRFAMNSRLLTLVLNRVLGQFIRQFTQKRKRQQQPFGDV
jgi:hypothetical protein